ncbi:MAG TPA: DUF5050 domain-containing protein [Lachnospiraceae bacterium]|nr:DUF5050 domain-containing protein [Lachnospiraceae bacterium]
MQKKLAIGIVIVLIILTGLVISSQFLFKIPENPEGTVGNTAGNLNNSGLFREDGDTVFFSNPYDNDRLYSMNLDGSNKKLLLDVPVEYINSAGDYLYFYQKDSDENVVFGLSGNMHGIYRLKKEGEQSPECLDRTLSGIVVLIDNAVYYQHYDNTEGMTLYRTMTDDTKKEELSSEIINPACVIDGNIYYPDTENSFYLSVFNTESLESVPVVSERVYNPVYEGGYIYYMNVPENYSLYRYSVSEGTDEQLTADRVDTFNVLGSYIFYQKNDAQDPALIRINTDGSNPEIVAKGNYTNINMTSYYTYFQGFGSTVPLYQTPTSGGIDVTEFSSE